MALLTANIRYWTGVAPLARAQLRRWERRARAIEDPELQALALAKLRGEGFNAEAAAILATLAPRQKRGHVVEAIVALEILFDYLDGLTERPTPDPLGEGNRLFAAFTRALEPGAVSSKGEQPSYLEELSGTVSQALAQLPAARAIAQVARRSAARSAQAQIRMHATPALGTTQLREWASAEAAGTDMEWRELLAGAAASVLALHALIAAAADPRTTQQDAIEIEAAYLSICALPTLLDGLIDGERDRSAGVRSYTALYTEEELAPTLAGIARKAATKAASLRNGAFHRMTLAGAVAYYTSAPEAGSAFAKPIARRVQAELHPQILPLLAIMRTWRLAKRWRARGLAQAPQQPRKTAQAPQQARDLKRATIAVAVAALAIGTSGLTGLARGAPRARSARTQGVRDEGSLRFVNSSGSDLLDEGTLTGSIPGRARVSFTYDGSPDVTAHFRIYARTGTIVGWGRGHLNNPNSPRPSFRGSLTITGGSRAYAHARGSGELFGVFDRRSYGLRVQTIGRLRY